MRMFERLRPDIRWRIERMLDVLRSRPRVSIACGAGVAMIITTVAIASSGGGPRMAMRMPMVDVRTGKVLWVSAASRAIPVPGPHPESGERTLLGAERMPDGFWRILPQDLELLASVEGTVSPRIDRGSGVVHTDSEGD